MNLSVTAEGVETEGQLRLLRDLNCGEAQGFYLSRPMPAADASGYLARHKLRRAA